MAPRVSPSLTNNHSDARHVDGGRSKCEEQCAAVGLEKVGRTDLRWVRRGQVSERRRAGAALLLLLAPLPTLTNAETKRSNAAHHPAKIYRQDCEP